MSGGNYNYTCFKIKTEYENKMYDIELNDMMKDLYNALHDLEWWQSGDIAEEKYRETISNFKDKWFGKRDSNLRNIVIEELNKIKETIELL